MKGDLFFVLEHEDCVLKQGYKRQNRNGITKRRVIIFFVVHDPVAEAGVLENVLVVARIGDLVE